MKIIAFGVVATPFKCNQRTRVRLIHLKLVYLAKYQFFSKLNFNLKTSSNNNTHMLQFGQ